MSSGVMELSNFQLLLTYSFVVIAMVLTSINGINRNKEFIIAAFRMTIQLFIAGYILVYIFGSDSFIFSALMILFMESSAVFNIINPKKKILSKEIKFSILISQFVGSLLTIIFFLVVVVRPNPIYNPQYLIPLGGMLISNSMTAVNLALNHMINSVKNDRNKIEGALMLGATPRMAMDNLIQEAFDTAIMPSLNGMRNLGIISLPGMMTGQILSGTNPLIAIRYQIAITSAILGSAALCVFIFLGLGYKNFFNKEAQLIRL